MNHDLFMHFHKDIHHFDSEYYAHNNKSLCKIKGNEYQNPQFICIFLKEENSPIIGGKIDNVELASETVSFCYTATSSNKIKNIYATCGQDKYQIRKDHIVSDTFVPIFFSTFNSLIMETVIALPGEDGDAQVLRFDFFEDDIANWLQKLTYLAAPFGINIMKLFTAHTETEA